MKNELFSAYTEILKEEAVTAMGCTEPAALAYGAAFARELLGSIPEKVRLSVSGNLVKNAKSVTVPNTDGLCGIEAAAAAGIIAGDSSAKLDVISSVSEAAIPEIKKYLEKSVIETELSDSPFAFDYTVYAYHGNDSVTVRMANTHTNIVYYEKNGEVIRNVPVTDEHCTGLCDHGVLTVEDIVRFADETELSELESVLERQIECNMAIAEEGMRSPWGACIGQTVLKYGGNDISVTAKAYAAAASDARMNGCALPVVILSGSGNQGITASVPVICYAKHLGVSREKLFRALIVSDLVTVHLKSDIGRLSAFCGAVCAGAGAGTGICYLEGGGYKEIAHTLVNALAVSSGIICDGAKSSCAAKIALAVEAGIMGWNMYKNGNQFYGGDGIVSKGVERTIRNIGALGHDGMKDTDKKILEIMTERPQKCR